MIETKTTTAIIIFVVTIQWAETWIIWVITTVLVVIREVTREVKLIDTLSSSNHLITLPRRQLALHHFNHKTWITPRLCYRESSPLLQGLVTNPRIIITKVLIIRTCSMVVSRPWQATLSFTETNLHCKTPWYTPVATLKVSIITAIPINNLNLNIINHSSNHRQHPSLITTTAVVITIVYH